MRKRPARRSNFYLKIKQFILIKTRKYSSWRGFPNARWAKFFERTKRAGKKQRTARKVTRLARACTCSRWKRQPQTEKTQKTWCNKCSCGKESKTGDSCERNERGVHESIAPRIYLLRASKKFSEVVRSLNRRVIRNFKEVIWKSNKEKKNQAAMPGSKKNDRAWH